MTLNYIFYILSVSSSVNNFKVATPKQMEDSSVWLHEQAKSFEFYLRACDKASIYLTKEAIGSFNNTDHGYRIDFNTREPFRGVEIIKLPNAEGNALEPTIIDCHLKRLVRKLYRTKTSSQNCTEKYIFRFTTA